MGEQFVSSEKQAALQKRMDALGVLDRDISESFVKGQGSGGQKQNKTSSCVQLHYMPQNITIQCQDSRSRELNRYKARQRLCDQLESLRLGAQSPQSKKIEKIRKQKKRRKRRSSSAEG